MKRYETIRLEAEKGITFEVSEETGGELLIRALNIATSNVSLANYENPPIPEGYRHVCGKWNTGYVIERISDKSQFVWIPTGSLDANGTIDGEHFTETFGRRNYRNNIFSEDRPGFYECLSDELLEQIESVKKYGGFYISRYNISKGVTGKPQSVKGAMPWTNINFCTAKKVAAELEDNEKVKSHLIFGSEYDSVLEWFIHTGVKTFNEIAVNSSEWGNHDNTKNSPWKLVETGTREEWKVNNIYDFAGNVDEWTQENQYNSCCYVIRGSGYNECGHFYPAAHRGSQHYLDYTFYCTGFRVALYIK